MTKFDRVKYAAWVKTKALIGEQMWLAFRESKEFREFARVYGDFQGKCVSTMTKCYIKAFAMAAKTFRKRVKEEAKANLKAPALKEPSGARDK